MNRHQIPVNDPSSPSGLILSLSHTLDRSNPLARSARKTARRLAHCQRPPARLLLEAAEITARLLDVADDTPALDDADLLDSAWDEL